MIESNRVYRSLRKLTTWWGCRDEVSAQNSKSLISDFKVSLSPYRMIQLKCFFLAKITTKKKKKKKKTEKIRNTWCDFWNSNRNERNLNVCLPEFSFLDICVVGLNRFPAGRRRAACGGAPDSRLGTSRAAPSITWNGELSADIFVKPTMSLK